jgi:hypothetical protein
MNITSHVKKSKIKTIKDEFYLIDRMLQYIRLGPVSYNIINFDQLPDEVSTFLKQEDIDITNTLYITEGNIL